MIYNPIPNPTIATVSNSDGTLTISPTTGSVVASLALGHANTWTGAQNFNNTGTLISGLGVGATASNQAGVLVVDGNFIGSIVNKNGTYTAKLLADSNPAYSFIADQNTGLNSGGADILNLVTGGTTRLQAMANGNIKIASGLNVVESGSAPTMGIATLSSGTNTVSTTAVTANSRIFLSIDGGTLTNIGTTYISARTAGTSFTISSSNVLDASNVAWILIEPS